MNLRGPASDLSRRLAPPDRLLRFLEHAGAGERPHSGRHLLEHLAGTYQLLRAWGCSEDACRAGLFHSIYGTSSFKGACIPLANRAEVAKQIGTAAEQLAYLFAIAERPAGLLRSGSTLSIVSRLDGTQVAVSRQQSQELIAIECANLVEQGEPGLVEAVTRLERDQMEALLGRRLVSKLLVFTQPGRKTQSC
jgi:hypothetical protein